MDLTSIQLLQGAAGAAGAAARFGGRGVYRIGEYVANGAVGFGARLR